MNPAPPLPAATAPRVSPILAPHLQRPLGWALIVMGSVMGGGATWLGLFIFDGFTHQGQPGKPALGASDPALDSSLLWLCGAACLFGLAMIAAGIFQVRTGRRAPLALRVLLIPPGVAMAGLFHSMASTPVTRPPAQGIAKEDARARPADANERAVSAHPGLPEPAPKNADAYRSRGDARSDLGRFQEAVADYTKVMELNPADTRIYCARAAAYRSLGQTSRAIEDLDRAIALDPRDACAYISRGAIYCDVTNQPELAVRDFAKAIELDPKDVVAYTNLGNACLKLKKFDQAIAKYSKAIELDPNYATAYQGRAFAYQALGKAAEVKLDVAKTQELAKAKTKSR